MKRTARVLTWLGVGLGILIVGIGLLVWFAVESQPGQSFLLRTAIGQSERFLDGEVRVGAIRSDGLYRGFTLRDVAILDDRGRPFFEADSLRLGYSVPRLLRGEIVLSPADVWGPRVTLETLAGDESSNLVRIFRLEEASDTTSAGVSPGAGKRDTPDEERTASGETVAESASTLELALNGMRVHDGAFILRTPVEGEPGPRAVVTEVPGFEGRYTEIQLRDINARLARARIMDPDEPGEYFDFESLSLRARFFEDPVRIESFEGDVRRVGTSLIVGARTLELPGSRLSGQFALDWGDEEAGLQLELQARADPLRFADLHWLEPRIPDGEGSLTLSHAGPLSSGIWRVTDADLRSGASRVRGRLGLELGDGLRFVDTELVADPVHLALLDPWLTEPLPVGGRLRGPLRLAGPIGALGVDGTLEYDDPDAGVPSSTIEGNGTLLLGEGEPGVEELSARVDPLDFETLEALLPDFSLEGTGSLSIEATGRLSSGIQVSADLRHRSPEGLDSRVLGAGSVQVDDERVRLSIDGGLDPLELTGIAQALELELPVEGPVSGPYRVEGWLSDLSVWTRLTAPGGSVTLEARGDVLDPGQPYRLTASTNEFDLTALMPDLPEPTMVRGSVEVEGRGLDLETVEGTARVQLEDSRTGHALLERAEFDLEALDGRLLVHELLIESPMGFASGAGELGLRSDAGSGELALQWEVPELSELRPLLMGDTIIEVDTLTALELETLRWDGVDPDTIMAGNGRLLEGTASGEINLSGSVRSLRVDGFAELARMGWSEGWIEDGRIDAIAQIDSLKLQRVEGVVELSDWGWDQWSFEQAVAEGRWIEGEGAFDLELMRRPGESYRADAGFSVDSTSVEVDLRSLVLEMDEVAWALARASTVRWSEGRMEFADLEIASDTEETEGGTRIQVDGVLDLDGISDLTVETERLDLARLGQLARIEDPPSGFLDLSLQIDGPADAPVMDGEILLHDFDMSGAEVERIAGTLSYQDRTVLAQLDVDHEGQRLLVADARYPIDLSFRDVENRFPDRDVDVTLEIDALPAATILAFVEGLEAVEGTLEGQIVLQGEPRNLRTSGAVRLSGGAMSLPDIGLQPEGIEAEFELSEDGTVTVAGQMRSEGLAEVSGTIDLNDLTDPGFDLQISASNFRATQRRDLEATVGGEVTLTGRFLAPRVGGTVRVEEGVMFLEEIARSAEVVDLTDPAFFDVVDTTLVADRPAVEAAQNPFLNNLVVNVDLSLERDFWLRSREMNVEIGGDLIVTFDRPRREILLVGTLQAIRGNYVAFGRQFQVQDGIVEFVGTPGINPRLDIQAVHRLRRESQEPLNIIASVEGPLMGLRISLTSEAQPPIAQSDLISYLLFGRPSFALGSSEASVLEGAAGAGVSVGIGTLAGQLSSVLAQQIGLDYFSITQTQDPGLGSNLSGVGGAFADTQIEVGQYVAQDLYLALILRPLGGAGGAQTQIPGARLEWRFTDTWTFEAFVEDRFGREGVYSFGDAGLQLSRIFGFELYRQWGY